MTCWALVCIGAHFKRQTFINMAFLSLLTKNPIVFSLDLSPQFSLGWKHSPTTTFHERNMISTPRPRLLIKSNGPWKFSMHQKKSSKFPKTHLMSLQLAPCFHSKHTSSLQPRPIKKLNNPLIHSFNQKSYQITKQKKIEKEEDGYRTISL